VKAKCSRLRVYVPNLDSLGPDELRIRVQTEVPSVREAWSGGLMTGFNLPPGVSVSDIPGNEPEGDGGGKLREWQKLVNALMRRKP